jgi:hypothetical protein
MPGLIASIARFANTKCRSESRLNSTTPLHGSKPEALTRWRIDAFYLQLGLQFALSPNFIS